MTKAALDGLTAAVLNSSYFGGLAEYGVGMPTFAGGFLPDPSCPQKPPPRVLFYNPAYPSIIGFFNCEIQSGSLPTGSQVVYNIILPTGTLEADLPPTATSWHFHQTPYTPAAVIAIGAALLTVDTGAYAGALVAFVAALGAVQGGPLYTIETADPREDCGTGSPNVLTACLIHEMIEVATDPFTDPITIFNELFGGTEIADVAGSQAIPAKTAACPGTSPCAACPDTHPFTPPQSPFPFSGTFTTTATISVPQYWSNAAQKCVTGFTNTVTPVPGLATFDPETFAITITGQGFGTLPSTSALPGIPPTIAPLMPYIVVQDDTAGVQFGSLNTVVAGSGGSQLPVVLWTEPSIILGPGAFVPRHSGSFWICNPASGNCGSGVMRPMIESINPSTMTAGTATPVTIRGENFYNPLTVPLSVSLSDVGLPLTLVGSVSGHEQVNVSVPASAPLGVHVIRVDAAGGSSTSGFNGPDSNILTIAPSVTSIGPANGPNTGGTPVTVTGTGFNPTGGLTDFFFGKAKGTLTSCNVSTTCVTFSPSQPGFVGAVDVQASVQLSPGSPAALSPAGAADKFNYDPYATLIAFRLPNAFFGVQNAGLAINGAAPSPYAEVILFSSDQNPLCQPGLPSVVCLPLPPPPVYAPINAVFIPAGAISVDFPLEFRPISTAQDVTLTARYMGSSVPATAHLVPWPPLTIMANWAKLNPQRGLSTISVTIYLNAFAPMGGAAVRLSSNPSVFPDQTVTIKGSYWTTVTIPVKSSSTTASVTITATYNGASSSTSMVFLCTPKRPCGKGTYWNNQDCQCEQGMPQ